MSWQSENLREARRYRSHHSWVLGAELLPKFLKVIAVEGELAFAARITFAK